MKTSVHFKNVLAFNIKAYWKPKQFTNYRIFFYKWSVVLYNRAIRQMSRVFTSGPGDQGSIPGRVIPTTPKIVLDATLLNSQHY